ncbi:MAG: RNA polymerase sigma factor [Gammaproteobacteria bacterium]
MIEQFNQVVIDAQNGEQSALEQVVRNIQDRVHHLAMRILVNPDDASDATQEILILVITKLSTFEGKSSFQTWVYRVATNYLLNAKKISNRDLGLNFDMFRTDLEMGLTSVPEQPENNIILNELRIVCTMAMLLCLDMKHRIAYVIGDILELDQSEAIDILGITKENYRKRLSRARTDVLEFTSKSCGLVNEDAKCSCPRRLSSALKLGRVHLNKITYATKHAPSYLNVLEKTKNLEKSLKTLCLQKSTAQFDSPKDFGSFLTQIVK